MAQSNKKIGIVSISLAKGGAERSTAILTKMLNSEGFDVHLVLLTDAIDYEFEGQLLNLGIDKVVPDTSFKRFKRIRKFRAYIKQQNFDFIIDNRARQSPVIELMYLNYVYKDIKTIYVIRSYHLDNYLTKNDWISKLIIQKAYKIIGVSEDIARTINIKFSTDKAICIHNPIETLSELQEPFDSIERYILFLGRFDDHSKNFSLLMEAYAQSKLPENSILLYLIGDGEDKDLVEQKINSYELQESIKTFAFTKNVYPILNNALFLVLSSRYEGFPRVLIEALSVGTPVISVDCQSGPSEIIQHEQNGLLVENHNPKALADAFNRLLLDEELYQRCKDNSIESVSHLNQKNIAKQWSKILNDE